MKIYQTKATYRIDENGNFAEDLLYSDKSKASILSIRHFSTNDFSQKTEDYLHTWQIMYDFRFTQSPLDNVVLYMISHFMGGSGSDYANETLTGAVKENARTKNTLKASKVN